MVLLFFTLQIPNSPNTRSLRDKLQHLNVLGLLALLPGVICLCLALQWGGITYAVSFEPETLSQLPFSLLIERTVSSGARGVLSHCLRSPLCF